MEPLEFCDICFQRGKPNLCETYKNTFVKLTSLQFSQKSRLDRLLNRLEIRPKAVDKRWTITVDPEKRQEFLDSLWGVNVSVHTLVDHIKSILTLYKPDVRNLGDKKIIELPVPESWEEFDPKTRDWIPLKVHTKNDKSTTEVNLGNVLKCSSFEGTMYYRTFLNQDIPAIVPMEKRAAYNIISTLALPIDAMWKNNDVGTNGFVDSSQLLHLPDEIYNILRRFATIDKKLPNILIFENGDYESIKSILASVKINLIKSEETVKSDKKSDSIINLDALEKQRLQVFLDMVKEMGAKISVLTDSIMISGSRGEIKIQFVDSDKSKQEGNTMQLSVSALEDPPRFVEILFAIKKKLGLIDMPLESLSSQHWPILSDNDLQYVIQSAISWWSSNPVLAIKILGDGEKFASIKEWNKKIKEGKIRSSLDTVTLGKIIKQKDLQ